MARSRSRFGWPAGIAAHTLLMWGIHRGGGGNIMTIILVAVGIMVVLAIGVGAMFYLDHRQRRAAQHGGWRV